MNNYKFLFFITFTLFLINNTFGKSIKNTSSNDDKVSKKNSDQDQHYLIFVNNTFGEINIFEKPKNLKRKELEPYEFAFSLMDEIHELIVENIDTYKEPEKLEEMEKESKLQKRSDEEKPLTSYDNSAFVYPISSIGNSLVLTAFLSKSLVNKIKKFDGVEDVVPDVKAKISSDYNENDILRETNWNELSVQPDANLHLALLSQGMYHKELVDKFDYNYYYPSSAGEDIDIIILDSSFNFDYEEFQNYSNRYVDKNDKFVELPHALKCGNLTYDHGQYVSDMAGGYKHGSAKKANIYGISLPTYESEDEGIYFESRDIFEGLDYILKYMIRPHKTVINLSFGSLLDENKYWERRTYTEYENIINEIVKKGAIVVVSVGNEGKDVNFNYVDINNKNKKTVPCILENTVCVGGIDSRQRSDIEKNYIKANESNYGKNVDIYAPYYITASIFDGKYAHNIESRGTSFASPLTAGVIATIMSENSNTEYDKDSILVHLRKDAIPFYLNDELQYIVNNGKHIVYSSNDKYNGCGISAGNKSCDSCQSNSCNLLKSKLYDCNSINAEFVYDIDYNNNNNSDYACYIQVPDDKKNYPFTIPHYNVDTCFDKIEELVYKNDYFDSDEYYQKECERKSGILFNDGKGDYICLSYYTFDNAGGKFCLLAGPSAYSQNIKKIYCVNDLYTSINVCNQTFNNDKSDKNECYQKIVEMNNSSKKIFDLIQMNNN
ncbi:hypothetical protein PIROE2DRAFT_6793 [Piromyces sp. E2]|nr:hypothetical protein PIROE2DRAFT_6793 [Piromyces sp. E2]|eukprot:OUM66081.1 hypothetical protein PIROE2DRAFT_6793 [Piromyces sp. E2]